MPESPTHPDAPRAGGETPGVTDERAERLRLAIAYARTGTPHYYSDISIGVDELEALLNARASLLERHRDGERSAEAARIDARFISEVRRAFNAAGHTAAGFEFRVAAALQDLNEARAKLPPLDGPKVIQSAGPSPERASK